MRDARCEIEKSRCEMRDARCEIEKSRCEIKLSRCEMRMSRGEIEKSRCEMKKSSTELFFCTPNEHSRRAATAFFAAYTGNGRGKGHIFPGSISDAD